MIVLDTNVISEVMRSRPDPNVVTWMEGHRGPALYTTTITEAEILYGIELLPDGRRRDGLREAIRAFFDEELADRVLPFERRAAAVYAPLAAGRRALGYGLDTADMQIAAIARVCGFALATRNTRDFTGCGIALIDPFTPAAGR